MSEAEILSVPVLVEIGPGDLVVRASRKHRGNVKLLLQQLQSLGVEITVKEEGLYCHYCEDHPVFPTEDEWEAHRESHERFCEYPGCPAVVIPERLGADAYFCKKHEEPDNNELLQSWRIC